MVWGGKFSRKERKDFRKERKVSDSDILIKDLYFTRFPFKTANLGKLWRLEI